MSFGSRSRLSRNKLNEALPFGSVYAELKWKRPVSPKYVGVAGRISRSLPSTVAVQVLTSSFLTVPSSAEADNATGRSPRVAHAVTRRVMNDPPSSGPRGPLDLQPSYSVSRGFA